MADYKGIQGYSVQSLASDPTASLAVGQLWYNSASNVWKVGTVGAGAWAAGAALNTPRPNNFGGADGTTTATLVAGGGPATPDFDNTETYNGTAWTETGNELPQGTNANAIIGTTTAALSVGGEPVPAAARTNIVNTYDGSSWTAGTSLSGSARNVMGKAGTQTAAFVFGGETVPQGEEQWNGTSWTETANMNTARCQAGSGGTTTAALCIAGATATGGPAPSVTTAVEEWNGTSWATITAITAKRRALGAGVGSPTSAVATGGSQPPSIKNTEIWNGTSWTEGADQTYQFYKNAIAGTGTAAIMVAQQNPPWATTEVWSGAPESIETVTTS